MDDPLRIPDLLSTRPHDAGRIPNPRDGFHDFDLDHSDEDILETSRVLVESEPEFQPMAQWRESFAERLDQR